MSVDWPLFQALDRLKMTKSYVNPFIFYVTYAHLNDNLKKSMTFALWQVYAKRSSILQNFIRLDF